MSTHWESRDIKLKFVVLALSAFHLFFCARAASASDKHFPTWIYEPSEAGYSRDYINGKMVFSGAVERDCEVKIEENDFDQCWKDAADSGRPGAGSRCPLKPFDRTVTCKPTTVSFRYNGSPWQQIASETGNQKQTLFWEQSGFDLGKYEFSPGPSYLVSKRMTMVALGDSIAAGEGNPDHCGQPDESNLPILGQLSVIVGGEETLCKQSFSSLWLEPRDHRSMKAPIFVAARMLAEKHPGLVPITLSFAKSGADTIDLFYGRHLPPQIYLAASALADATNGGHAVRVDRKVDSLIISVGGNDVGFSGILTLLGSAEVECVKAMAAPHMPIFSNTPIPNRPTGPAVPVNSGAVECKPNVTIAQEAFHSSLTDLKSNLLKVKHDVEGLLNVDKIYVVEYPVGLFSTGPGEFSGGCDAVGSGVAHVGRGSTLADYFEGLNISVEDAHSIWEMGNQLNIELRNFVNSANGQGRIKWVFVDGVSDAFQGHGYCTADPYFVKFAELCSCQGNAKGVLHPNAKGIGVIADLIVKAIERNQPEAVGITSNIQPILDYLLEFEN